MTSRKLVTRLAWPLPCSAGRPQGQLMGESLEAGPRGTLPGSLAASVGSGGSEHSSISLVCSQENGDKTVL